MYGFNHLRPSSFDLLKELRTPALPRRFIPGLARFLVFRPDTGYLKRRSERMRIIKASGG
jgi:hypothetical protein